MCVLLVEDYAPIRESVTQRLQEAGFAVDAAADGEEGLWYAQSGEHDVIVLDIALPKLDGLSLLRQLRQSGQRAPVLLLTARDTITDRVTGLDSGADDYLVKPFALEELLARVRALLRRGYNAPDPVIRMRELEVNTVSRIVRRAGERIDLTAREYTLLEFLAHRAGKIVTRSEIWEHVYDFRSTVESNTVDVYIGYRLTFRYYVERRGIAKAITAVCAQGIADTRQRRPGAVLEHARDTLCPRPGRGKREHTIGRIFFRGTVARRGSAFLRVSQPDAPSSPERPACLQPVRVVHLRGGGPAHRVDHQ